MRTTALALLVAAACFTTGCPKKTAETPAPPTDSAPAQNTQAMQAEDSGTPGTPGDTGTPAPGGSAAREACVDRWLQEHKLDRYGHPEGTMYTGGSPLFNEATGETQDRLEHVFARQPDARTACP